jgi:hypothetical protein
LRASQGRRSHGPGLCRVCPAQPRLFSGDVSADAVPLDRYPDARKREDEAFGKLVEGIGQAFANQPTEARQAIAVACWAMVHGLATLILEGSLARKLKIPRAQQRQVADEVIGTFMRLVGNNST